MHAHQPVCEPCMHTALVCMLAVHDTVCTLLQRTAGQGYWTYIVAKKSGEFCMFGDDKNPAGTTQIGCCTVRRKIGFTSFLFDKRC